MSLDRKPDVSRYIDSDQPLAGKCMSCGKSMGCLRMDAESESNGYGKTFHEPGVWTDLLSAECPNCGARVFVMGAEEFRKVVGGA